MRKTLFLFCIAIGFIITPYLSAKSIRQKKIDSLLKELPKAKDDTNKVNLLSSLSFNYYSIEPDKGIEYAKKGVTIAKKLNWKSGEAKCYNTLGVVYSFGKSDYRKALDYYQKALEINQELDNESGVATDLMGIGIVYENLSDYPRALEYYQQAIKIEEKLGNKTGVAKNLGNIGIAYEKLSDYPKALENYHKALKINEELGNKDGIAANLGNIGVIYDYMSNYPLALEYYFKSLKINEELGDKKSIAVNLGNIGIILSLQSDFTKSLDYFKRALRISEELGNKSVVASNLNNIAAVYLYISDFTKALEYYNKGLKIEQELGDKSGLAIKLGNMGTIYYLLSQDSVLSKIHEGTNLVSLNKEINLNRAIEYFIESIESFEKSGELRSRSEVYKSLSDAYSAKGDYKKAYEAFKEYKTLQDSVFSMEKSKEIANLEAKRENELKDKEIELLNSEKKAQTMRSYLMGGGIVVLLGAFGLAFLRYREKRKLSNELTYKNTQILDSIDYASTIQHAILPWKSHLDKAFPEYFILFKPKDVVSGDCYWFKEVDGVNFLAVIDCTGHGVPGSMLTVIATSVLDDAVLNKKLTDTSEILTYMNTRVTEVLNQRLEENKSRDGMEVCLVAIHQDKIQYSGAGRPLFVKNGEIRAYKTDRRGIAGSRLAEVGYIFNSEIINARPGITLYLSSDGYSDQLNEDRKKMGTNRFRELLESISEKPMLEQKDILDREFAAHIGNQEQTDDVTVIGIKL